MRILKYFEMEGRTEEVEYWIREGRLRLNRADLDLYTKKQRGEHLNPCR
jgi:hypothetical protein